jgi:hypothetical protein
MFVYIGEFSNKKWSRFHKIDIYQNIITKEYFGENIRTTNHELGCFIREYEKPVEGEKYNKDENLLFLIKDITDYV